MKPLILTAIFLGNFEKLVENRKSTNAYRTVFSWQQYWSSMEISIVVNNNCQGVKMKDIYPFNPDSFSSLFLFLLQTLD